MVSVQTTKQKPTETIEATSVNAPQSFKSEIINTRKYLWLGIVLAVLSPVAFYFGSIPRVKTWTLLVNDMPVLNKTISEYDWTNPTLWVIGFVLLVVGVYIIVRSLRVGVHHLEITVGNDDFKIVRCMAKDGSTVTLIESSWENIRELLYEMRSKRLVIEPGEVRVPIEAFENRETIIELLGTKTRLYRKP